MRELRRGLDICNSFARRRHPVAHVKAFSELSASFVGLRSSASRFSPFCSRWQFSLSSAPRTAHRSWRGSSWRCSSLPSRRSAHPSAPAGISETGHRRSKHIHDSLSAGRRGRQSGKQGGDRDGFRIMVEFSWAIIGRLCRLRAGDRQRPSPAD